MWWWNAVRGTGEEQVQLWRIPGLSYETSHWMANNLEMCLILCMGLIDLYATWSVCLLVLKLLFGFPLSLDSRMSEQVKLQNGKRWMWQLADDGDHIFQAAVSLWKLTEKLWPVVLLLSSESLRSGCAVVWFSCKDRMLKCKSNNFIYT